MDILQFFGFYLILVAYIAAAINIGRAGFPQSPLVVGVLLPFLLPIALVHSLIETAFRMVKRISRGRCQ